MLDAPSTAVYVFSTQSLQSSLSVEPVLLFCFPVAHLLHFFGSETPDADEYRPGKQSRQSCPELNRVALLHFPAVHPMHCVLPVLLCVPILQSVQLEPGVAL